MKIALVVPSIPKYSETFLTNKIAGLKSLGFDVVLMVVGVSEKRDIGVPVKYQPILAASGLQRWLYTFWLIFVSLLRAPIRVGKLLRETKKIGYSFFGRWRMVAVLCNFLTLKNVDWIHFAYGTMAVERAFIGKILSAKVAMSLRGYDMMVYPLKNPNAYESVWPYLTKVHCLSHALGNAAKTFSMPEEMPIAIITPAVDVKKFETHRKSLPTKEANTFITVGRLHWIKAHEYVLKAFAILKANGISFTYTIVGDGAERERILFAIHQLNLVDEVQLMSCVQHSEIPQLLANNSYYVQYSHEEGFCNAVIEAQAAGMLCVVSDAEGLLENVVKGNTGLVAKKRDPKDLARCLMEAITIRSAEKDKIRQQSILRVKNKFSLDTQRQYFKDFYEKN